MKRVTCHVTPSPQSLLFLSLSPCWNCSLNSLLRQTNGRGEDWQNFDICVGKGCRHFSYLLPDWQLFLSSGEGHWFHLESLLAISKVPEIPTFQPPPPNLHLTTTICYLYALCLTQESVQRTQCQSVPFKLGKGLLHPDLSNLRLSFIMDSKVIFSLVSYLFILGYFLYIKNSSSPLPSIYIANFHRIILNLLYLPTWPTPLDN